MKKILLCFSILFTLSSLHAQLNIEFVSQLDYDQRVSDIWGYTAADGTEYAMVGLLNGVSFVSLADPENPEEVVYLPGDVSRWRDLRSFGDYAYVVADQPGSREGLWAIDMTPLPDTVIVNEILFEFDMDSLGIDTLFTCHNVWVDEKGFAYLTGCDINSGGVLIYDLNNDPMNPEFVGMGNDVYSHDNYVRGDTLYTSEINEGQFGVYDIADRSDPILLGIQETPFRFTHNVWLSDNSKVLFTTDEKANAPVGSYDVSDPSDIIFLDEFRPAATLGTGVLPHNVHVLNDYLVISYYTDGCIIVDAHEPDNLVEVGNYDTNTDFTNGFHGAWGAYPFFPSGLIAISDIENGLFILRPEYKRASYLEGRVTNINTGIGIPGAEVNIQASAPTFEFTNLVGFYKTGLATPGTYNVTFSAVGYFDQTVLTTINTADITELDVQLVPLPAHTVTGLVVDEMNGAGIPGAVVFIENEFFTYEAMTDANGQFELPDVLQGSYDIYVGKWGYQNLAQIGQPIKESDDWLFELPRGYADNFNTGLGWQVGGDATSGIWERAVPFGTSFTNSSGVTTVYNPLDDSPWDVGGRCYVTGNTEINDIFQNQVDGGTTLLASPPMELASRYMDPVLSYDTWWYTAFSNNAPNDTLRVWISNGQDTVLLEEYGLERRRQEWEQIPEFRLSDFIAINDNMQFLLTVSDEATTPNIVEAGIDNFLVTEAGQANAANEKNNLVAVDIYPNPFYADILIDYKTVVNFNILELSVTNTLGQPMENILLKNKSGQINIGNNYPSGTYFIYFKIDREISGVKKVVKF
ncbi:MAG: choice-of-anchor B family protein [Bacteroidota bacterium]